MKRKKEQNKTVNILVHIQYGSQKLINTQSFVFIFGGSLSQPSSLSIESWLSINKLINMYPRNVTAIAEVHLPVADSL